MAERLINKNKKGRNTRSCLSRTENYRVAARLGELPAEQGETREGSAEQYRRGATVRHGTVAG